MTRPCWPCLRGRSLSSPRMRSSPAWHFLPSDAPGDIARKALRVNLSDLAAKGACPLAYTLTLAVGRDIDDAWIAAFASGLAEDQVAYGIGLRRWRFGFDLGADLDVGHGLRTGGCRWHGQALRCAAGRYRAGYRHDRRRGLRLGGGRGASECRWGGSRHVGRSLPAAAAALPPGFRRLPPMHMPQSIYPMAWRRISVIFAGHPAWPG